MTALGALLALPIVVWLLWGWIEAARLNRALDRLERRNEQLDVADFEPKPSTPEQRQASHLYADAGRLVDNKPITVAQAAALSKTIEALCSADAPSSRSTQARILLDFEEDYQHVYELLEQASRLDAMGWDEADRPDRRSLQEMRPITLARVNVPHIARLACTGNGDAAAAALLASLRLRRVWVGAQIAPIALQTAHSLRMLLSFTRPSPALLDQLRNEYLALADETRFAKWMARERAQWLSMVMPGVFSDAPPELAQARMTPLEGMANRLVRPLRDHRLVKDIAEFDSAIDIAKQPWPGKLDAISSFAEARPSRRSQSIRRSLLDQLTQPLGAHFAGNALSGYINGMTETLARNRASAGAIAVQRYRQDHDGTCPANLQQLIPQYLSASLIDPYSGVELKYRCDDKAFKVYSVGANRKDDGGTWEQHSDLQLFRRGNPLDVGIAMSGTSTIK